jgi:hypothetical protein
LVGQLILKNNVHSKVKGKTSVSHILQMLLPDTALKFPEAITKKTGTHSTNLKGASQLGIYKSNLSNWPNATATRGATNIPQII